MGWFPGQFNRGVLKSDQPRNYPLNQTTALYIAPVLFPKQKWLGLAPAFFGIMQAVGHGLVFPRIADDKYSPGSWPRSSCMFPSGSASSGR